MRIKTLFIANLAEVARPLASLMLKRRRDYEIAEDHGLCDRFVFSGGDRRLLITPFPLDSQFLSDSSRLMGFRHVQNLWPKEVGESLSLSILKDKKFLDNIVSLIRANSGISILSYAATPEFLELLSYFKKKNLGFRAPEVPYANPWTTAFFDSKAGFRQTAYLLGSDFPPLPKGAVCQTPAEILGFAKYLYAQGKDLVIKANRGLAGAGLFIVKRETVPPEKLVEFLRILIAERRYLRRDGVVVEEFIEPDLTVCGGAPNVELRLDDGEVEVLYTCGMRVSPQGVFEGVELGHGAVPRSLNNLITKSSRRFGRFLKSYGYRGFFELDFVNGRSGKIYSLEANLRRTGGTHVYELGRRVLGADFLKNYYLVANNMRPTKNFKGVVYAEVRQALSKLIFPVQGKREGVILTVSRLLSRGNLGYVVIGRDRQRTYEIEKELLSNF